MWEAVWEAITESLISFPILLVVYFLMELLENKQQVKFEKFVAKSKKTGPLWGSVIGCVPQCAFSAVMADLFSKKMITSVPTIQEPTQLQCLRSKPMQNID